MDKLKKKPPIFDDTVKFNANIIAEILGLFLKCNPQVSVVVVPEFRIKQLTKCSRILSSKAGILEGDVFEAIGSLYALCLYYGGSPELGNKEVLLKSVSVMETILSECIMALETIGDVFLVHPEDRVENFKRTVEKLKQYQLATFTRCNELLKDILRDTVRQVRICRDKGASRTKSKQPVDCLMAHSIFIMCAYGLAHVTAVLHAQGRLGEVPGLYEALLCVMHFDCRRDMYKVRAAEKQRKARRLVDVDRYEECTRMARNVCYVVLKKVDITYIGKLRTLRARLSRGQTDPFIDFAKLKSQMIGSDLLEQSPPVGAADTETTLHDLTASDVERLLLPPGDDSKSVLSVPSEALIPERCIPAEDFILTAGTRPPESLVMAMKDMMTDEVAPLTIAQRESEMRPTRDDDHNDGEEASMDKEFREMIEINKLPNQLRSYYVFSRPLREFLEKGKQYFNPSHQAQQLSVKTTKPKVSTVVRAYVTSDAVQKDLEQVYYDSATRPMPRFLNQSEGMYWACDVLVEYIFQQVNAGNMFADVNQKHLSTLQEKARKKAKELKKCRQTGLKTLPATVRADSFANATERDYGSPKSSARSALTENSLTARSNTVNLTQMLSPAKSVQKSNVYTITRKLTIVERLSLAHDEAVMERKLDDMKAKSTMVDRVSQLKAHADYLETNFPFIGDELNPTDSVMSKSSSQLTLKQQTLLINPEKGEQTSVVWTPVPEIEDEMAIRKKKEKDEVERRNQVRTTQDFDSIPSTFGLEYARSIQKYQEERRREKDQFEQELVDLQEIEIAKIKAMGQRDKRSERDAEKKKLNESLNYKKLLEDQKKEIRAQKRQQRKQEEKEKQEREEAEEERLREMKTWSKRKEDREKRMKEERFLMEKVRLRNLANKKEYEEILRSHKEEMRMKYLEEIQRAKEERRNEEKRKMHTLLMQKRKKAKEEREKVLAKIRKGNFMYHHGKLGFYADIMDEERPYIQYEDDEGIPYYFDPVTLRSQYEMPSAPIVHYTVKERAEHDRLYGEGSYDAMMADRAFKEQCNIDGGYLAEDGKWVPLAGYYDENYEFVSMF